MGGGLFQSNRRLFNEGGKPWALEPEVQGLIPSLLLPSTGSETRREALVNQGACHQSPLAGSLHLSEPQFPVL